MTRCRQASLAFAAALALGISGCRKAGEAPTLEPEGRPLPEGERLFRSDPRWLGADAALSIPLGRGRTLWLFGDTFVATSEAHLRSESKMVRNTVGVQTGLDPRTGMMAFHWHRTPEGAPASFFPEDGERWWWPGHGIRLAEGPLVVFLYGIVSTPKKGLGFESAGWALALIDDPDASPADWKPRIIPAPAAPFDAVPATAVVQDGGFVVAVAIRQAGVHCGYLVRWPADAIARGDLGGAAWWWKMPAEAGGPSTPSLGWVAAARVAPGGPAVVLDDAGAECSLHRDARTATWVHVASYGFGATTIGLRTAASLTGPWSAPLTVFRPPESDGPRPFVYAAKAHPELVGPAADDLVVTYATNSFEFGDLFSATGSKSLYWPRLVAVRR